MPDEPSSSVSAHQYSELAELAGGFIHEIKNHLSTLGLNLQLLTEDFENPETQRERRALNRIQRLQAECTRLVDISNDFLRFARLKELDSKKVRLSEVVDELLDFFEPTARQSKVTIKNYVPTDLPIVTLDVEQFKQALLNLVLNAEQAMPEGGEITLIGTAEPDSVRLDIIDTGDGLPPEVIAKIFKPFFTTKPGGNGLGLPITRKIIEAHGGKLEVASEPGHGTKFTVWLPVKPSA